MNGRWVLGLGAMVGLGAAVVACGSDASTGGTADLGGGDPAGTSGDPDRSLLGGNGTTGPTSITRGSACAEGTAAAQRGLSFLAFQFDRSGSMGSVANADSNISVCKGVLQGFFSDPKSKGLSASLSLFPQNANPDDGDPVCSLSSYSAPVVQGTMQALPSAALSAAAAAITTQHGTPTLVALQGAHAYATSVSATHGGAKVAVVLVTDGQPNACPDNVSIKQIADYLAGKRPVTPTYVIGIGRSLTNLHELARAGSGRDAFLVDTSNPAKVQSEFAAALNTVRTLSASCELSIPAPPSGQTLDTQKVNVLVTTAGKESSPLYDTECNADGWRYDNAGAPTKVILCPSTCQKVQADPDAKVELLFGCKTSTVVAK